LKNPIYLLLTANLNSITNPCIQVKSSVYNLITSRDGRNSARIMNISMSVDIFPTPT